MALDFVIVTNHRPYRQHITPPTASQLLLTAIKHDDLDAVVHLIDQGVDLSTRGDNCWTPLTLACHLGRLDAVKYLLHRCDKTRHTGHEFCDLNSCNDHGDTPLICAARWGHEAIVQVLVDSGADPNVSNQYNSITPLLVAIDGAHIRVVTQLLSYDADVQLTDNVKMTPLYTAIKLKDCEIRDSIVKQLIQAGCDVNIGSQDHAPIFLAARLGYLSVVKMLCKANCDVNVANKYGVTPVYEAAIKGHNSVLMYLLSLGCQVNKADMYGVSPLHAAALFNNPTAVKLLLQGGGSVKQRDQSGRCAVHTAMERGYAEVVEVFLRHGVDITRPPISINRLTSLSKVFEDEHVDVVRVLISGCSRLPFVQCPAASRLLSSNPDIREMLKLSGLQGICHDYDHNDSRQLSEQPASSETPPEPNKTVPLSLQNICRIHVRKCLGNTILYSVSELPLPNKLKDFLTFR